MISSRPPLLYSPQMFPSVVFKSGNNGPAVLGGAEGGPSDPSGLGPLGGQTLPRLDIWTMDRDLSDDDSEYSRAGQRAPLPGDTELKSLCCPQHCLGSASVLLEHPFLPSLFLLA